MSKKLSLRLLSILLVLSLIVTLANQGLLAYSSNIVNVMASNSAENGGIDDYITCNGTLDLSTVGDGQTPQGETQPQDTSPETTEVDEAAAAKLWSDGMIHVFHFRQLQLIGTGASLTDGDGMEETVGKGNIITDENGNAVIYSNKANYFLEGDITLPKDAAWTLPDDFSGEFSSEERKTDEPTEETGEENTEPEQENADQEQENPDSEAKGERLYDAESDTIYIQNVFQLLTLSSEDRERIPVMTGDTDMETFGTGELIYPQGETGCYLTYSTDHNYVISSSFTAGIPEETSPAVRMPLRANADANLKLANEGNTEGRDYAGQVVVTIGGTDYILIGNYQQLEALNYGEDKVEVYGPVMKVHQTRQAFGGVDNWVTESEELYYPGDADLAANQKIFDGNNGSNGVYHKLGTDLDGVTIAIQQISKTRNKI